MPGKIDARLNELGLTIPTPPPAQANYVPWRRTGNQVWIAGQGALQDGELKFNGRLGDTVSVEEGYACARIVALNILGHLRDACEGDLDRVVQCVKLGGFVCCTQDFQQTPQVINGASDLLVEVFGDAGKHARFAVGAPALPFGISVEIDAVFEIE
jgi:enamine deaminase RidA (YjgF/YER057c/UK114 family)